MTSVPRIPVCGIGASAGGIEALQQFFEAVPADLGLAYVIVVHLAPDRKSELPAILGRFTSMAVVQVGDHDQVALAANTVYVIAPDSKLEITDTLVGASPFERPRGQRHAIDLLFRSLAATHSDGFAIVLSGSGADGALGAKAVKESGGLVLVQDPAEAAHGDMPRAVISTGVADLVLPVRELAHQLAELARDKRSVGPLLAAADNARIPEEEDKALRGVLELLRRRTGHDFSKYKRATVLRRLSRRMQLSHQHLIADYLRYLRTEPGEVQALLGDLLISVTAFFRDPDAWTELRTRVLAPLVERTDGGEQIRAWVAGCATGEEAYSLAILLHEEFESRKLRPNFIVFASDVDEGAVSQAREGVYPRAISTDVSEARLERYFRADSEHYYIENEIRSHVVFAVHSILRDPPFSRQHLISCRNLLIYLDRELQEQVMSVFRYALRDHGYLFLGASELASDELFKPIDARHRIFVGLDRANDRPALPEILSAASPSAIKNAREPRLNERPAIGEVHLAALELASAPSILVDDRNNVLHLSPTASRYLQQSGGVPARRLTELVRPELRDELHALLHRSIEETQSHLSPFVAVAFNGSSHRVAMLAQRHAAADDGKPHILVTFLDAGESREHPLISDQQPTDDLVRHLREQLRQAEQRIETMRDDHFLTNEELRAANEELQSLNEEYRSTTEELETSKEELQSINEELQTLNHELKSKLEEISRTHADLENFVAAADIAILFLDRDLRIKRYTPRLADIFSIRSRDIDRPIGELVNTLNYSRLEADCHSVLVQSDEARIEREVHSGAGKAYIMRVSPYRSLTQREADGVVVTFVDVTAIKQAEVALRRSEERYRTLFDSIDEGYCTIEVLFDAEGTAIDYRFIEANPAFARLTGFNDAIGRTVRQLLPTNEDFWLDTYAHVAVSGEATRFEHLSAALGRFYDVYAFRISAPERRQVAVLFQDITDRKRRESNAAFLAEISQDLVQLIEVDATMTALCGRIFEHFNASHCVLGDVDDAKQAFHITFESRREDDAGSMSEDGVGALAVRGVWQGCRRGEPCIVRDTAHDARMNAEQMAASSIGAFVTIPIARDGHWRFMLSVITPEPRDWRDDEVALLEEVTARVYGRLESANAEHALRGSESRKAFLMQLTDQLRPLAEPAEIMAAASAALGRHLGVDRCGYGEIDETGHFITLSGDYRAPGMTSLKGRQAVEEFGTLIADVQRAGQTLVITDTRSDPGLTGPEEARTSAAGQVSAGIVVPLIKKDRYMAVLFVHQSTRARDWTPEEVTLVEDVAERTWDAVERARVQGALRQAHAELEQRVLKRTADLASAISSLQDENVERRSAEAQNKALFQRLLKVQEDERRSLARDLHDQLGQQLTALRMNVEALVNGSRHDPRLASQMARVQRLAAELDQSVDFLTWDLRPASLAHLGLAAALEELFSAWSERFDIPSAFEADGTETIRLPPDVEANVYRIAQEALHNTVKHAKATRVAVSLSRRDDHLELRIEDNGRGFVVTNTTMVTDGGLGLISMRERAGIVGGTFEIDSEPERGTTILVRIPIRPLPSSE